MPDDPVPEDDVPGEPVADEPVAATTSAAAATSPAFVALLELVGHRWTLRIVWELRGGPLTFNALRIRAGGMSQSVLVTRLTELYGAGLVADVAGGYQLTRTGTSLAGEIRTLAAWADEHPR